MIIEPILNVQILTILFDVSKKTQIYNSKSNLFQFKNKISFNDTTNYSGNQLIETSTKAIVIKYIAIICDQICVCELNNF